MRVSHVLIILTYKVIELCYYAAISRLLELLDREENLSSQQLDS